jgi:predicted RNase H-like HicB family nuclease
MTKVNTYTVLLERDSDGWIIAKVPAIPGCATQGKTVEQALERIKEAITLCVETEKRKPSSNKFIGVQQIEV